MKKIVLVLCGLLLASGIFASSGQSNFGLNFGIMDTDQFKFNPLMWSAGAELDFHFTDYLMLSPEVTLVGNGFKFKEFLLFPGAILNFTPDTFFLGGGVVKGIYLGGGETFVFDEFSLKLNAGFNSRNVKLTAYVITSFDSLFDGMLVGVTLGFWF
jgi:hypothetical protein